MPRTRVKDRWVWHLTCNSRDQGSEIGDSCSNLASQFSHSYEVYVQQTDLASNNKVNSNEEKLLTSALGFCIHVSAYMLEHTHTHPQTHKGSKKKKNSILHFTLG